MNDITVKQLDNGKIAFVKDGQVVGYLGDMEEQVKKESEDANKARDKA